MAGGSEMRGEKEEYVEARQCSFKFTRTTGGNDTKNLAVKGLTKTRLLAGSTGTVPVRVTKMPKLGV